MEVSLQCGNHERAALIASVLAARALSRRNPPREPLPVREVRLRASWRELVAQIAGKHGVSVRDLLAGRRVPSLVDARHELWWHLNRRGVSLAEIGRRTGGYDHTSVMYGVRRWARLQESVEN